MPLNETKPALTLYLPYLLAQSSLFIQTSVLYEWCSHALAATAASPPFCLFGLFGLLCYLCHDRCHHLPWNPGQKLMGHAATTLFLRPFVVSVSSPQGLFAATDSSPWARTPLLLPSSALWLTRCASSLVSSDMSTSQMWPCYFLLKSFQELPTLAGSCSKCTTGDRHCVIQLLLLTPWAVHWLDSGHIEPLVFPRWAHLSRHDTGRQMVPQKEQKPLHLEDTVQASPSPISSSWVSKWNNSIFVALSPHIGLWLSMGKLLLVFLTCKFCTEMHRPWRQLAPSALGQREKLWEGSFDTRRESVSRK